MEHKLILGGESFLPFARSRIKALKATGLKYASQSFEVDGVSISVKIAGEHEYIRLEGGCPDFMSGVILRGWNKIDAAGNEVMESFYPSEDYAAEDPRAWRLLKKYPPMTEKAHGADFNKFKLPYLTHHRDPFPELVPPPPYVRYTDFPQVAVIRPGMYSGLMRSVVQYMLGTKAPIKFDYHHNCTHGIMNVPTADGKTSPWVIEISAANGVLASKLKVCTKSKSKSKLGYTPLGSLLPCSPETLEAKIASGDIKRLLPASALNPFYANAPVFSECGWAFSYSGREAQNTGTGKIGIYQTASRYKISLSHSDGEPSAAAVALVDTGYMINNPGVEFSRSQVRIPSYALQGCITMDMRPDMPAHTVDSICPIYVYYDGEQEQVVKWWNEKLVPNTAPELPDFYAGFSPDDGGIGGTYYVSGSVFGGKSSYYQITSPIHPSADLFTYGSDLYTYTPLSQGPLHCWSPPGSGNTSIYLFEQIQIVDGRVDGKGTSSRHTVTIPLYEREVIYHFRASLNHDSSFGGGSIIATKSVTVRETLYNCTDFQDIDGLGNPSGPYRWRPIGAGIIAQPGPFPLRRFDDLVGALSPGWPASYYGASWDSPEADKYAGRVVIPIVDASAQARASGDRDVNCTHAVCGSGFATEVFEGYTTTLESSGMSWWFFLLPQNITGNTSQFWAARSADGLYVLPTGERYNGMGSGEFIHNIEDYPTEILALSAPSLVFVGNAAKPTE